jgi:hypothetical protein
MDLGLALKEWYWNGLIRPKIMSQETAVGVIINNFTAKKTEIIKMERKMENGRFYQRVQDYNDS